MLSIFPERRIEFNYEEFGDSPTCLSEKDDIGGIEALVQGKAIYIRFDTIKC